MHPRKRRLLKERARTPATPVVEELPAVEEPVVSPKKAPSKKVIRGGTTKKKAKSKE